MSRTLVVALCAVAAAIGVAAGRGASNEAAGQGPAGLALPDGTLVDLTHPFNRRSVYWPTAKRFRLEEVADGETEGGYHYAANNFEAAEHGGTHLDAPQHFARDGQTADEVPLERLAGQAVVVDVSRAAARNRDLQVGVAEFRAWEQANGAMPRGAIVLLRTGFGRFYPDRRRYMGTAERGAAAVAELHFPGLAPDGARFLVRERGIKAVGLDTPSIDYGQSKTFRSHRVLGAANVPVFENVANLQRLPPRGSLVIALPMKIDEGSGGPLRAMAVVPR